MKPIFSYDVFDTCLTRIYARPTDLFYDLAHIFLKKYCQHGYDENAVALFVRSRRRAEREIRNINRGLIEDIQLITIYQHLKELLPWKFDIKEAMHFEMQLERASFRTILTTKIKIDQIRRQGYKIIFISDMYLPTKFIKQCLIEKGIAAPEDAIYVSGDIGLTKHSGNLYQKILEIEGIQENQLRHCGDNYHADIAMANKHGIVADYFTDSHLSYYEHRSLRNIPSDILVYSKLSATSRLVRLNRLVETQQQKSLSNLASNIIAPFLTAFVTWVLKDAQEKGIERLYFVSRDGQIMYKIAQKLVESQDNMPECRYLYGSRQAWFAASIDKPDWKQMEWLIQGHTNRISDLLTRLCLSQEELLTYLSRHKLENDIHSQAEGELLERFKKFILDPDVFAIISARAKELRENVVGYFTQEGLFDKKRWALVDLGWMLNCQASISRILNLIGWSGPVEGYYLGIRRNAISQKEAGSYYGWIIQDKGNIYSGNKCHWLFRSNIPAIIEHIFTPADHCSLAGYQKSNNKYFPVFVDGNSIDTDNLALTIHYSVLDYLDNISHNLIINNLSNYTELAISNAGHFFSSPPFEFVHEISNLIINREQSHSKEHNRQLASVMTMKELFRLSIQGNHYCHPQHVWLEGSAALSPRFNRILLRAILRIRNIILISKGMLA